MHINFFTGLCTYSMRFRPYKKFCKTLITWKRHFSHRWDHLEFTILFTNLLAKLDCSVAIDLYKSLTRKESLTGECPDKKHYQHQW